MAYPTSEPAKPILTSSIGRYLLVILLCLAFTAAPRLAQASASPNARGNVASGSQKTVPVPQLVQAARPAIARPAKAPAAGPVIGGSTQPWVKIGIVADGYYTVSCAQLQAAGVTVAGLLSPTLQVYAAGSEIALDVSGPWAGACATADTLAFYAQGIHTRYTDTNYYWLTWGAATGKRMTARTAGVAGTPTTVFTDTRPYRVAALYLSNLPFQASASHWFWGYLSLTDQPYLPAVAPGVSVSATIQVELHGYGTSAHTTSVLVNGTQVGSVGWSGKVPASFTFPFSQVLLSPVTNTVQVKNTGSAILVAAYTITYQSAFLAAGNALFFPQPVSGDFRYTATGFSDPNPRAFDITDPANVVRLTNTKVAAQGATTYTLTFSDTNAALARYLAVGAGGIHAPVSLARITSADLHNTGNGADYILITHASLITSAQPLAAFRASQGLRVKVVDVQSIYDEFNNGLMDQQAIHDFLYFAYNNWQAPRPQYVLLLGAGTFDFKNAYASTSIKPNLVPPGLVFADAFQGEIASDNYYVAFGANLINYLPGVNNNLVTSLPSMAIGRLPVQNTAEAAAVIAKIIGYEQAPAPGPWRTQMSFATDTGYVYAKSPAIPTIDPAGNFWAESDSIFSGTQQYIPAAYQVERIYYNPCVSPTCTLPVTANTPLPYPSIAAPADVSKAITTAVQAGRLFVNYVGHAAVGQWSQAAILTNAQLAGLSNANRLAVFLGMTCFEGQFDYPTFVSLQEANVRLPNGGALAAWAASGEGVGPGHLFLDQGFFDAVMNHGVYRLGPATMAGKQNLVNGSGGAYYDLLDTFNLLGDPASRLSIGLWLSGTLTLTAPVKLGTLVTQTTAIVNLGPAVDSAVTVTYTLPPNLVNLQLVGASVPVTPVAGTNGLVYRVGALGAGAGIWLTVTAMLAPQAATSPTITLNLTTTATGLVSATNPYTDSIVYVSSAQAVLDSADLAVRKTVAPGVVNTGALVAYTLVVTNHGSSGATNVVLTDSLPVGVIFNSHAETRGSYDSASGAWRIGSLASSAVATLTLSGMVDAAPGDITNSTSGLASDQYDPDHSNDSASAMFNVQAPTAIHFVYFSATVLSGRGIQLTWAVSAVCSGFNLYRSAGPGNDNRTQEVLIHYEPAMGPDKLFTPYRFIDRAPSAGAWWYWLTCVSASGAESDWIAPGNPIRVANQAFLPVVSRRNP